MLAGAGTGVASSSSQATEVGLVFSTQPGAADHCHRRQYKRRAAQHVRLSSRSTMQTAEVWCSLELDCNCMLQKRRTASYRERTLHAAHVPGAKVDQCSCLIHAEEMFSILMPLMRPPACRVNPGQGNDGGMLAGGSQTGGLGNANSGAEVAQPPLPPGVARPPAIPGTPAYARQQVDDCPVVQKHLQHAACHSLAHEQYIVVQKRNGASAAVSHPAVRSYPAHRTHASPPGQHAISPRAPAEYHTQA